MLLECEVWSQVDVSPAPLEDDPNRFLVETASESERTYSVRRLPGFNSKTRNCQPAERQDQLLSGGAGALSAVQEKKCMYTGLLPKPCHR